MGTRALLVSPEIPPTYWSMHYALPFLGKKAVFPPLGLMTVAALLPTSWELSLVDLNVEQLSRKTVASADLILISAMLVQRPSFERVVAMCNALGKPVVAGGPYPTRCHRTIQGVDHLVLGEAEVNLPVFLSDFGRGQAKRCYADASHPDIRHTAPPRYDLAKRTRYVGAALQYSRGCPHRCEFCDVVDLFGHTPRTKSTTQFLNEIEALYRAGWRGSLFIVDDNFIGNRVQARALLPELTRWQQDHGFPYSLFTEASLDLAEDPDLMAAMVNAGFSMVFVGIETPDKGTLAAAHKQQNCRTDLLESVRVIQRHGLEVAGGFVIGFDQDPPDIFERQIQFIDAAAIPTAMVGLLTALPGTQLARRLDQEGRLRGGTSGGNNTHDLSLNFEPRMDPSLLRSGYLRVLNAIYDPRSYFRRCLQLIRRLDHPRHFCRRIGWLEWRAFVQSLFRQSFTTYVTAYWAYLVKALFTRPRLGSEIIAMAVKGHHFFTITRQLGTLERLRDRLDHLDRSVRTSPWTSSRSRRIGKSLSMLLRRALFETKCWCQRIHPEIRAQGRDLLDAFHQRMESPLR